MKRCVSLLIVLVCTLPMFSFAGHLAAESGDLVINEIMFNPKSVSDSKGEWFEVFNPGEEAVDLIDWCFSDGDGDHFQINCHLVVPPQGFLTLGRNDDPLSNGGVDVQYRYSGMNLNNSGDIVMAIGPSGTVIDIVDYSLDAFPNANGASIELKNPLYDNSSGQNWAPSFEDHGMGDRCTPGAANSCLEVIPLNVNTPPLIALNLVLGGEADGINEWISSYAKAENTSETVPNEIEVAVEGAPKEMVLFCDNKGQYYDHLKAKQLFSLLAEMGLEVIVHSYGELSQEALDGVSLLIITNPQNPFSEEELESIDRYLERGGKIMVSGQYFKYISTDALNDITSSHGVRFTSTEILDDVSNTGKAYYPMVEVGGLEMHLANCCALEVVCGEGILFCEGSARVIDPDGNLIEMPTCVAATSGDGSVLCLGSSSILTTTLYRADNWTLLKRMICDFMSMDAGHGGIP